MTASWLWLAPFAVVAIIGWWWTDRADEKDAITLWQLLSQEWEDGER